MHSSFLPALLLIFSASVAPSAETGQVVFDRDNYDFGQTFQFTEIDHDFRLTNISGKNVTLSVPAKLASGLAITIDHKVLGTGESALVHAKLKILDRYGASSIKVPITVTDGRDSNTFEARVSGFVESILDNGRPGIDLGIFRLDHKPEEHAFTLESSSEAKLEIKGILEAPDFVTARVSEDRKTLFVKAKPTRQLGFSKASIRLGLSSTRQPEIGIAVLVDVRGNIVPDQNPLALGLQKRGSRNPVRLQISSTNHTKFKVGDVTTDPMVRVKAAPESCLPSPSDDCEAFLISILDEQPFGQIVGKVHFPLPDSNEVLSVDLTGIYLADDVEVRSLDKPGAATKTEPLVDITKALQQAVTPKEEVAIPEGKGPLLSWRVGNEAAIYGYAVFRAASVAGTYQQIGAIIRAKNKGDNSEADYHYRDNTAIAGNEYWYYIAIFYNSGKKVQLTGPQKVVAK